MICRVIKIVRREMLDNVFPWEELPKLNKVKMYLIFRALLNSDEGYCHHGYMEF